MCSRNILGIGIVLAICSAVFAEDWQVLFDGASLDAFENPYDWGATRVEGDEIHLKANRKFFLCSKDTFSNFVFEAEVRLPEGKSNSGFMFRASKSRNKVTGYQAEADDSARAWSGGLYGEGIGAWKFAPRTPQDSPSGQAFRNATSGSFDRYGWNKYRIECSGDRIRIFVNDVLCTDYCDGELAAGVVALQHHGENGQVYRFRNARIKDTGGPRGFGSRTRVVFDEDCNDLKIKDWRMTDPQAWRTEKVDGSGVLNLCAVSNYDPKVRSPKSILWLCEEGPDSFIFDAVVKSTEKSHAHRDVCIFFGRQDDEHFYYTHIAEVADPHAHSIFAVDGKPRKSIASRRNNGIGWGDGWHRLRVERDATSGSIRVYFDDLEKPVIEASDKRFIGGGIGIGSFDNTALFDNLRLVEVLQ